MAEMRDKLQRAKLVQLEGYDYGIHFLSPDAVVAEVREFLRVFNVQSVSHEKS
jgi:hypothetical protein